MRIELGDEDEGVLGQMIDILLRGADVPPKEVEGVSAQFLDGEFFAGGEGKS